MTEPTVSLRAAREQKLVIRPHSADAQPAPPTEATEARAVPNGYKLPCDVHLPPATVIRAGCDFSTLKLAMEASYRPRHFEGNPRASLPAPTEATPPHDGLREAFDWEDWLLTLQQLLTPAGNVWQGSEPTWQEDAYSLVGARLAALSPSEVQPAGLGYAEGRIAGLEEAAQVADASAATCVPLMKGLGVAASVETGRHRAATEIAIAIRTLANGERA